MNFLTVNFHQSLGCIKPEVAKVTGVSLVPDGLALRFGII